MTTENRPRTTAHVLTLRVGQDDGNLIGRDEKPIQAALDYVRRLGGGRVEVGPGVYEFRAPLVMPACTTLVGSGTGTVFRKAASHRSKILRDADWYETRIDLEDPSGIQPGDGILLRATSDSGGVKVVKRLVMEVVGQSVHLSDRILDNMWLELDAEASTLFPLVTAEELTHDVTVEDLVLDGNKAENEEINGNYAGGVFIQRCDRWHFARVRSTCYNGDGFSFQVCDDICFEDCQSIDNANLGFHPGSGSQRPRFTRCESRGNSQGLFFCWGVSDGRAESCVFAENRDFGISVGHRDTDNLIIDSVVEANDKVGILFREQSDFRSGHRTTVRGCTIRDNGTSFDGAGIDIRGRAGDLLFEGNCFEDSGGSFQRIGVLARAEAGTIIMRDNTFKNIKQELLEEPVERGGAA